MVDDLFPTNAGTAPAAPLSVHVVDTDRWDREDNDRQLAVNAAYRRSGQKLAEFVPTGGAAMDDMFWSLMKADPALLPETAVRPSHRVNRAVQAAMRDLPSFDRLRRFAVGDDVQAALSASAVEPDLETIFDQFEAEQSEADKLDQMVAELAEAIENREDAERELQELLDQLGDEPDEDGSELAEEIDGAREVVSDAAEREAQLAGTVAEQGDDLNGRFARRSATMSTMVDDMLDKATEEAEGLALSARGWGVDPAEMKRLPAAERLELARKLNSPEFREIAKIFGSLHNLMLSAAQERTVPTPQEMYDVEYGNDLSKVLPSELLLLTNPLTRLEFYRRFMERDLLQYAMQGKEKLSRGGIINCIDGSGSMSGPREHFAKAFMLVLISMAKEQKRTMHVVHFGSRGRVQTISFEKPEDFTFERIVEAAEIFEGGGTDFETPMAEALEILQAEFGENGGTHSDVVFVTDDECRVPEASMKTYLDEMHRMEATTWGVACSGRFPEANGALLQMTEGKVALMKDFVGGKELRPVFRDVA